MSLLSTSPVLKLQYEKHQRYLKWPLVMHQMTLERINKLYRTSSVLCK